MPEHIELPSGLWVPAHDVPLEPDAIDGVADGQLGTGEVGARLVPRATHQLEAALRQEPAQVAAVLGVHVPVGLEVVDLREHEAVVRILPGQAHVRPDQVESGVLECRSWGVLEVEGVPFAGVGSLGVPPHGVVVEVGDHVHGPAGLGDVDGALDGGAVLGKGDPSVDQHSCRHGRAGSRGGRDPDFHDSGAGIAHGDRGQRPQTFALDLQTGRDIVRIPLNVDADDL